MENLYLLSSAKSRSISPENFTGEKGRAGMATEGTGKNCARELGQGWKISPSVEIPAGQTFTLCDIQGSGAIKHIWMTDSKSLPRRLILRIYWDDCPVPSVEVPAGDFFANANYSSYQPMQSLAVCVNPKTGLNCYWQMPFRRRCRITMENQDTEAIILYYQIDYVLTEIPEEAGYFHAQFRRVNPLPYKEDYTILDHVEGRGQYVGTYLYWGANNNGWFGEGEIKFFMDGDKEFPTICGTGTEDYFCGSYDFDMSAGYIEFCSPYSGLNKVERPDGAYHCCQRFSMYRWHITDPIYFQENLKVTIQSIGWRSEGRYLPRQDDISSVAYWYLDHPCTTFPALPDRDRLEII